MEDHTQEQFCRLAEPVLAQTSDGQDVHLDTGFQIRWLAGRWGPDDRIAWHFEDKLGKRYVVYGRAPRMTSCQQDGDPG